METQYKCTHILWWHFTNIYIHILMHSQQLILLYIQNSLYVEMPWSPHDCTDCVYMYYTHMQQLWGTMCIPSRVNIWSSIFFSLSQFCHQYIVWRLSHRCLEISTRAQYQFAVKIIVWRGIYLNLYTNTHISYSHNSRST